MLPISCEWLFLFTASLVLLLGCWRTAEAVKFTSSPSDQVVVIGFNSSLVSLHWSVDLETEALDRLKVLRSSNRFLRNSKVLYSSNRPIKILEGFEDRINVTYVVDNGTVNVDFVVQNVTNSDEFYYGVWVDDVQGNQDQNAIFLDVKVPAHNVVAKCGQAILGRAMTCNCTADSDLASTSFQWRARNGTVLHNGSSYTTARVEKSLEGSYYTCVASDGQGHEAFGKTTEFSVLYKPSQATITVEPNAAVVAGQTLNLTCNADGKPPPVKFEWRQNGELQNSKHRVMVIPIATTEESGTYSCNAINDFGSATGRKNITVMPNECSQDSCNGNGNCTISIGVARCDCNGYWSGLTCSISKCEGDYCKNKVKQGNLESVSGTFTLLRNYTTAFGNKASKEYKEFSTRVLLLLVKAARARAGSITDLKRGSVRVEFVLYYDKGTTDMEMEKRVSDAVKSGKLGNYKVGKESLHFIDAPEENKPPKNPDNKTTTIVVVVVIVVVLVAIFVGVVVWRVKRKRSRKEIRAVNGDEHKMEGRPLNDTSVEAGQGPTVSYEQGDKKKRAGMKLDDLYTKVNMSKKSKKKKPEEIVYTAVDFEPDAATQSTKPKSPQQQNTDYACVTDVIHQGEGGNFEKVPLNGPTTDLEPPERPKSEKPDKDDTGTNES